MNTEKEDFYDTVYWRVFNNENLFHLLIDVCYLPSKAAHPDCWILTKLLGQSTNKENCGFISFAFKIHADASNSTFKKHNVKNTYQSSMEYLYTITSKELYLKEYFAFSSFFDLNFEKNGETKNILSIPTFEAVTLPNLPIAVSLSPSWDTVYEGAEKHAVQIISREINSFLPGAWEQIFKESLV